jgi:hypothetical protein
LGLLTLLALFRVFGQHRVRVGTTIPDISLWWFFIVAIAVFFFISSSSRPVRWRPVLLLALVLSVAAPVLSVWRQELTQSPLPKTALTSRLSVPDSRPDSVSLTTLQIEDRKYLNRVVGRRRDVLLDLAAHVRVPAPGSYRFDLACDDRCALRIDGRSIVTGASGSTEVTLHAGIHTFEIRYEQEGGPAYISVGWDGPELVEVLPLDHFVAEQFDTLSEHLRRARSRVSVSLALNLLVWLLALSVLLSLLERGRTWVFANVLTAEDAVDRSGHHWILILSLGTILLVPVLDLLVFGVPDRQVPPGASGVEMLRAFLLACGASLFVAFVHLQSIRRRSKPERLDSISDDRLFCLLRWPMLVFALSLPLVHVWNPELFSRLAREDGVFENLSALFLLISAFLMLLTAWRLKGASWTGRHRALLAVGLAGAFFVIGMEEISWGQRIFGFETPTEYLENAQHEANIHNIATEAFEILYYMGATVFLVIMPFIQERTRLADLFPTARMFVPGLTVLFLSAPLASYNYDMWNTAQMQVLFYTTVVILLYYAVIAAKRDRDRLYFVTVPIAVAAIQAIFLVRGGLVRHWELTEYKEFFIPLGFLVYALTLVRQAFRSRDEPKATESSPGV